MNRHERRKNKKLLGKEGSDLVDLMLNGTPDKCTTCQKPFDKKDKEMAMTWTVKVWNKERKVELYCPEHVPAATEQK